MMRIFIFLCTLVCIPSACNTVDEEILPLVGIYRTHIVGVAGPFDLIISTFQGDDVIIEAPFDGSEWYTIKADIDNKSEKNVVININNQEITHGTIVKGSGFFRDGTIQLNYFITSNGKKNNYTLVGTKM